MAVHHGNAVACGVCFHGMDGADASARRASPHEKAVHARLAPHVPSPCRGLCAEQGPVLYMGIALLRVD